MLRVRMRLMLLMVVLSTYEVNAAAVKKSTDTSSPQNTILPKTTKLEPKKDTPAIIAFEIVNEPEKNTTGKSNSKRTIESSLGYGYHGHSNSYATQNYQPGRKFVIYKYSQNDIPGYTSIRGKTHEISDIQKSVDYNFGTTTSQVRGKPSLVDKTQTSVYIPPQPAVQYYNPGTTLYTTYDQHGLGGVSNQVPHQAAEHPGLVPVIILKLYSNQLANPETALHTNLPQSHPYSHLNNINLQSYLQNYVMQYLQSQQASYQPNYQQHYQQYIPNYPSQSYYQVQPNYQTQSHYQSQPNYQAALPTYENYPSEHHTRVVYHSDNNGHIPVSTYKTPGLSTYRTISVPMYVAPTPSYGYEDSKIQYTYTTDDKNAAPQYTYVYPNAQEEYYQNSNQQYEQTQNYEGAHNEIPSSSMEGTEKAPYNYHAHPTQQPQKKKS